MTLSHEAHRSFDNLEIWLEPTVGLSSLQSAWWPSLSQDTTNRYKIGSVASLKKNKSFGLPEDGTEIEFKSPSKLLPLPSEKYLKIHAACCKVAHLSGAAEHLEELDKYDDLDPYTLLDKPELFLTVLDAKLYDNSWRTLWLNQDHGIDGWLWNEQRRGIIRWFDRRYPGL